MLSSNGSDGRDAGIDALQRSARRLAPPLRGVTKRRRFAEGGATGALVSASPRSAGPGKPHGFAASSAGAAPASSPPNDVDASAAETLASGAPLPPCPDVLEEPPLEDGSVPTG